MLSLMPSPNEVILGQVMSSKTYIFKHTSKDMKKNTEPKYNTDTVYVIPLLSKGLLTG